MSEKKITLTFTENNLADFCRLQIDKSANPGHALASLTSLQAFIGKHVPPHVEASESYMQARERLDHFLTETRGKLLKVNGDRFLDALNEHLVGEITTLHGELSRSGFQQMIDHTLSTITHTEKSDLHDWAEQWYRNATERAQAASNYPDAPDFKAAGIDYRQYVAMMDTVTALTNNAGKTQ